MTEKEHGTSKGIRLTNELVEELAREAETGYDTGRLEGRRRRGRPPIGSKAASIFQVRLEPELREALEAHADASETTPSEVARRALWSHLQAQPPERPTRLAAVMTGEAGERFPAVAAVLRGGVETFVNLVEELGWQPQPESAAEFDLHADVRLADGVPLSDEARARIGRAVIDYAETTAGHVSSLSVLFSVGEVLYTIPVVVRATLEHALKVCWILEPHREKDPARPMSLRDRLARVYLEELVSAEHYKKTVGRLVGTTDDAYRSVEHDWKRLRDAEIPQIFGQDDVQLDKRPYRIGGQKLRGLADLDKWYSRNHVPGSIRGVYDALSNFTHPTLFAVRELTRTIEGEHGAIRARDVPVGLLERLTTVAVTSFYVMLKHVSAYLGWPRDTVEAWADAVNDWLPNLIQD